MTTSGPEPTEERRPTSESFRAVACDYDWLAHRMLWRNDETVDLNRRMSALLAAEDEHLPVFHVVEGKSANWVTAEVISLYDDDGKWIVSLKTLTPTHAFFNPYLIATADDLTTWGFKAER